jgi:hypothetical protein
MESLLMQPCAPLVFQPANSLEAPATRAELHALSARIDDRFTAFEQRVDVRFAQFEQRTDARFAHLESRFTQFEHRVELRSRELEERMEVRLGRLESSFTSVAATLSRLEEKVQHGASKAWVLGGVTTVLLSVIGAGWWFTQQYLPAVLKVATGA